MLNPKLNLSERIFEENIEQIPARDGYGQGLVDAGRKDKRIVALCADLTESTRTEYFKKEFPERFIQVGVAEQALVTLASGMANYGKIPFVSSYAVFSPGRNWEQIRTTIALNNVPVKMGGAHAGISVGADGATHQALEDIALMRVMPNMTVVVPCDAIETRKATYEAAFNGKPTYIRFTRDKTPVFTTKNSPFKIGRAEVLWEAKDPQVAVIGCGSILYEALLAAGELTRTDLVNTMVINCHSIKPLDEKAIISAARKCGAIVSVEEHQVNGGLGSAIAEVLARSHPVPMEFVGMPDHFGESGTPGELLKKWGMKAGNIIEAVKKVIRRKTS